MVIDSVDAIRPGMVVRERYGHVDIYYIILGIANGVAELDALYSEYLLPKDVAYDVKPLKYMSARTIVAEHNWTIVTHETTEVQ